MSGVRRARSSTKTKPKIVRSGTAASTGMRLGRGTQYRFVGPEDGAERLDVHLNVINTDSGLGPYHVHRKTENVYVVLEGVAEVVIDSRRYILQPGDVAFVPPGIPHAAGSDGSGPLRVLEIYAPGGKDFHILEDPGQVVDAGRDE